MTQPKLYHGRYLSLSERGIFMGRSIKNSDGQKADKKISLSVTAEFYDNVNLLADITNGGNTTDLIINIVDGVLKKNSAAIAKAKRARKSYQTTLKNLYAEIDSDSDSDSDLPADVPDVPDVTPLKEKPVAQDSPTVEKSLGSDDE